MKVKIFLFRHGQTDWNAQERFQGHTDIPLNEVGRTQARELIPYFKDNPIQAILSSDLSRADETGRIIADALGIQVFTDPGLREAFLGKAQGLTRHEIENQFGLELAARWRSSHVTDADISYPDGETGNQIMQRVFGALREFVKSGAWERIGVATHGGVIRRVMQQLLPPGSAMVPIPNGVIYEIEYQLNHDSFRVLNMKIGDTTT